jgi:hypothetical protein
MASSIIKNIENLVIELNKSYKALQFYPEGHPALNAAINRTINYIKKIVKEEDKVGFSVSRTSFEYEGEAVLQGSKEYVLFSKEFFSRNISKIFFKPDVTIEELVSFLKILSVTPKEIRQEGGIESVMLDHEIKNVWANEVDYGKILENRQRQEEEGEKETEPEEEEEGASGELCEGEPGEYVEDEQAEQAEQEKGEAFGDAISEVTDEEEKSALSELKEVYISDKELFELLRKLLKEKDKDSYSKNLSKIIKACHHLNSSKEHKKVVKVSLFLFSLTYNPSPPFEEQKELLILSMKKIIVPEVMTIIVDMMNSDKNKKKYKSLFLTLGEYCIPMMLDYLGQRGDIKTRDNIADAISVFGERAFYKLEEWLNDKRCHVVCGVIASIGKIGSESGVAILLPAMEHPDVRVKREIVKALGKIRSMESCELLLTIIRSRNTSLIRNAIMSLGELKVGIVVPDLIKLTRRGILRKNDIEVRKTAITAIGKTGSVKAIPHLLRILKSPGFFGGKEKDELRLLAVTAIGAIGGEKAVKALEIGENSRNPEIKKACNTMLEKVISEIDEEEEVDA